MKILMVNDYKYEIGGTETYMFNLINELKSKGHEVLLFSSNVTSKEYFSQNYNKSLIKYLSRIFNIKYLLKFKKILREFQPDIVHIHNIYNEITPAILFNLRHTIVIMTVHGSQMISPVSLQTERTGRKCKNEVCEGCLNCIGVKGVLYETCKRNVYRKLLKNISLYITPSEYLKSVLEERQYLPVRRIYNGINLLKYSKIRYTKNLLFIGRLTKEKGVEILLHAMNYLVEKFPEIHLSIVGEGNYSDHVREVIKNLHLEKNITLVGSVSSRQVQSYYDKSLLILIPSIYPDNLPTVGLEALSVGRPIIGSNIGGISEIIKNNQTGVLVEAGNMNQIVGAIEKLVENKQVVETMSMNARLYAEKYFDIRKHITQLEKLYSQLIKNTYL
ncbi:MAG TPA: glycosyltransferase family 4 protein [Candidatus Saccharimonadales bacterium]|nr:glycosyltransferase family 4 protein [Candidatus Saccharimonadales bacterium]